jgi:hypothetical protein
MKSSSRDNSILAAYTMLNAITGLCHNTRTQLSTVIAMFCTGCATEYRLGAGALKVCRAIYLQVFY